MATVSCGHLVEMLLTVSRPPLSYLLTKERSLSQYEETVARDLVHTFTRECSGPEDTPNAD